MSILLSFAIVSEIRIRHTYEKLKNHTTKFTNRYAPVAKSWGMEAIYRVRGTLVQVVEFVDNWLPVENPPCDKSILCLHEGRHRKGCHGYTEPIRKYTKGITEA